MGDGNLASVPDELKRIEMVVEFVKKYGELLGSYLWGKGPHKGAESASRSDLNDFTKQVVAIANDPNGSAIIEAAVFEDGKKKVRAAIKFKSSEARLAVRRIEVQRVALEKKTGADHERVIMTFYQANVGISGLGKRTGERVRIQEISGRVLPLIYASDLAEDRIKSEIVEAEDNLFRKGFVVDVNVAAIDGRPVAYRVTHVHQVIDIGEDQGDKARLTATPTGDTHEPQCRPVRCRLRGHHCPRCGVVRARRKLYLQLDCHCAGQSGDRCLLQPSSCGVGLGWCLSLELLAGLSISIQSETEPTRIGAPVSPAAPTRSCPSRTAGQRPPAPR